MPAGRPTDYSQDMCEKIIEYGKLGKSVVQMACLLDCHKATLYVWAELHPEFHDAFICARAWSQDWWENAAQNGMVAPGFNAGVWSRSMAARFPDDYTERQKRELSGADGKELFPSRIELVAVEAQ